MRDDTEPTIRTAVAADLPDLRHVYREASLSNAGDAPALLANPEYLVFGGGGIGAGHTRVAVAERVVGFVTVVPAGDGEAEVEDLFVDPGWQRRGIARRLVADATDTARRAGRRHLSVTGNPHALAFYLAVGFVETDRVTTELGDGLRMRLDLDQD